MVYVYMCFFLFYFYFLLLITLHSVFHLVAVLLWASLCIVSELFLHIYLLKENEVVH